MLITNQYYNWVDKTKKVGAQPNISAVQYDSMPIPVPLRGDQMKFVTIAEQADKSKYVLLKLICTINNPDKFIN